MRLMLAGWSLALCFVLIGVPAAQAQQWSEARPTGGNYRVMMPGKPTETVAPVPMPDGSTVQMLQAIVELGNMAFLGTHVDYPSTITRGQTPAQLLTNVRDGSAKGHTLRADRALTVDGYPAREYVIQQSGGTVVVVRTAMVQNRLYQMIVAGPPGIDQHADTRRFLDSFTLR